MAAGAPRTVSLSPEEMENLGKEMIQWLQERPQTLHLSEWYTIHKGFIYKEWKSFIQRQEFIPYYEQALKIVGLNYLNKDSKVRDGISQRWQRVYFKDLKETEDQDVIDEFERKKELIEWELKLKAAGHTVDEETLSQFSAFMNQLSSMQKERKESQLPKDSSN